MTIDYDANIVRAGRRFAVMREIPRMRRATLKVKGLLDRWGHRIFENDEGRCESQFSRRKLRKLDGDIEALRRELHLDTSQGATRLAEIAREREAIESKIGSFDGVCEKLESQARSRRHEGDAGIPDSVVEKRSAKRASRASAETRHRLSELKRRLEELVAEADEIEEVHRQRVQIACDSRNQLCAEFLIEMHIYLDAAKRPQLEPPEITREQTAEMKIA